MGVPQTSDGHLKAAGCFSQNFHKMNNGNLQPLGFSSSVACIQGFTLIENLIVLAISCVLMAIAAPGYTGLMNTQRVNTAQREIYAAMRQTEQKAIQNRFNWCFSVREHNERVEWAMHAKSADAAQVGLWKPLDAAITLDLENTTLTQAKGIYYACFDYQGNVSSRLGRVTVSPRNGGSQKRCVIVSTMIGKLRKGREHSTPDSNGRYCY